VASWEEGDEAMATQRISYNFLFLFFFFLLLNIYPFQDADD
jgi:hypothetical protein